VGTIPDLELGAALRKFARGVTWDLVEAFRNWMVSEGDAVRSINVRLSTVTAYAKLATKAGVRSAEELAMIRVDCDHGRNIERWWSAMMLLGTCHE
jgi:hypothetical protein